ncbi:unnamed protein product [Coccothraustes coccothraustes]
MPDFRSQLATPGHGLLHTNAGPFPRQTKPDVDLLPPCLSEASCGMPEFRSQPATPGHGLLHINDGPFPWQTKPDWALLPPCLCEASCGMPNFTSQPATPAQGLLHTNAGPFPWQTKVYPGPRTCPSLPTPGCAAGQSSFRPNTQTPVTQNNKKQRTQQGEKALGQKNASQDQEKAGPDDLGDSDGEPMRLREPWRNKTLSEGLSASVAKMPARESYCQNPLPILQFLQVLIG